MQVITKNSHVFQKIKIYHKCINRSAQKFEEIKKST